MRRFPVVTGKRNSDISRKVVTYVHNVNYYLMCTTQSVLRDVYTPGNKNML